VTRIEEKTSTETTMNIGLMDGNKRLALRIATAGAAGAALSSVVALAGCGGGGSNELPLVSASGQSTGSGGGTPQIPDGGSSSNEQQHIAGVVLPPYPWVNNGYEQLASTYGLLADQGLLNAFAQQYGAGPHLSYNGQMSTQDSISEFFNFWLPIRLFDIAAGVAAPPTGFENTFDLSTTGGTGRAMWLMHVTGFFLGMESRLYFNRSKPPIPAATTPFSGGGDQSPTPTYAIYQQASRPLLVASRGSAADVADFNLWSLRGGGQSPFLLAGGEVGGYGYDAGYLDTILSFMSDKARPHTPYFTYDKTKPLDATYWIADCAFLAAARAQFATIAASDATVQALYQQALLTGNSEPNQNQSLMTLQLSGDAQARAIWTNLSQAIPTPADPTDAEKIDIAVRLSRAAYFVQYNQANALAGLAAYATDNTDWGRKQARQVALFISYVNEYAIWSQNPEADGRTLDSIFPHFTYA
jgi:hypothetical protein